MLVLSLHCNGFFNWKLSSFLRTYLSFSAKAKEYVAATLASLIVVQYIPLFFLLSFSSFLSFFFLFFFNEMAIVRTKRSNKNCKLQPRTDFTISPYRFHFLYLHTTIHGRDSPYVTVYLLFVAGRFYWINATTTRLFLSLGNSFLFQIYLWFHLFAEKKFVETSWGAWRDISLAGRKVASIRERKKKERKKKGRNADRNRFVCLSVRRWNRLDPRESFLFSVADSLYARTP